MKSNQDQFTSTKFIGAFVLNQDLVACLINKSMIVQRGQWTMLNGKNCQIIDVVSNGIWIKAKGQIRFVTVENSHPHYGIDTNYYSLPSYASNQFGQMIDAINLPLLALAGGVALLLLTLIY